MDLFALLDKKSLDSFVIGCENEPEYKTMVDSEGRTLLSAAIGSYNKDIALWLIANGVDTNIYDRHNRTALNHAIINNFCTIADAMLKVNKDLVNTEDNFGRTPLHNAVTQKNSRIIDLLISNGADINKGDYHGRTPLDFLIVDPDIAKQLKLAGAKLSDIIKE